MKTGILNWLHKNNACSQSILWVQENNIQSLEEAWASCDRGDWLLWMAERLGIGRRKLVISAALCAHTVVGRMKDPRSREAVRIAFLWGRGKVTDSEVDAAWHGASSALFDAEGVIETWVTRVALSAIEIADNSDRKYRTNTAMAASAVACWSAMLAGGTGTEKSNQKDTANIVKKILTEDVMRVLKTIK